MRVYDGMGSNKGKVIYGDSDARGLMSSEIGIEPIDGWENISREFMAEFDRDMLDWFYSDQWVIYPTVEDYEAANGKELFTA